MHPSLAGKFLIRLNWYKLLKQTTVIPVIDAKSVHLFKQSYMHWAMIPATVERWLRRNKKNNICNEHIHE